MDRLEAYNFVPVVNYYLLVEIFEALVGNNWTTEMPALAVIEFIKKISLVVTETARYRLSPDPKDNYLFDPAIQNGCVFLISDDNKLQQFRMNPVRIHTSSWFLKKFPIH